MLTNEKYKSLIDARLRHPESFKKALVNRRRRKMIGKDGRLLIVAADHTARGIIAASNDPFAIANRKSLLDRLMRSLSNPLVDGVLASADIIEELAWLGALESKLVFGTMNRGGYLGSTWGLDDPMTAYDADHIASLGLDAGKIQAEARRLVRHAVLGMLVADEAFFFSGGNEFAVNIEGGRRVVGQCAGKS
jgi:hypothetical protein